MPAHRDQPSALQPLALDHVGLKVTDMNRSLRFYTEILGLELLRRRQPPDRDGTEIAVLRIGDQEINLFSRADFATIDSSGARGIDHFCLTLPGASIAEVAAALRDAGVAIVSGPTARRDGAALFLHDPDGVRVELQIKTAPGVLG